MTVARKGEWVQIRRVVLPAGSRAPQVPEDTAVVPLELKVKGFLVEETARCGETVTVRTAIGREHRGVLIAVDPPYDVGFGPPPKALLGIGEELREMLRGKAEQP
jgi:hypothetical protein